jgi:enoyl-[acyl-carrier protein] reductase I
MRLLEGKKAIVAGVANSKSIAWGIARAFHEHGAEVVLTCVESARRRVVKMAAELGSCPVVVCDAGRDESIAPAFEEAGRLLGGKLDVLVHSIAYGRLEDIGGEFISVGRDGWRLALEISAYSLVAMSRAARPLLKAAGGGSILTITFAGGVKVAPGYNVMGVAKAALDCTVRYLAYDLGPDKIRVNGLSPGPIPTMSSMVVERFEETLEATATHSPMLRSIQASDVGAVAVFYASDLSASITGSIQDIDGGMHILLAGTPVHPRSPHYRRWNPVSPETVHGNA